MQAWVSARGERRRREEMTFIASIAVDDQRADEEKKPRQNKQHRHAESSSLVAMADKYSPPSSPSTSETDLEPDSSTASVHLAADSNLSMSSSQPSLLSQGLRQRNMSTKKKNKKKKKRKKKSKRGHKRRNSAPDVMYDDLGYEGVRPMTHVVRPKQDKEEGEDGEEESTRLPGSGASKRHKFWFSLSFWQLLVYVSLAIVTTAQIESLSKNDYLFSRDDYFAWNNILFPPNLAPTDTTDHVVSIFTREQAENTTRLFTSTYYDTFSRNSVGHYSYLKDPAGPNGVRPVLLHAKLFDRSPYTAHGGSDSQWEFNEKTWRLTPTDLGPFDDGAAAVDAFFSRVQRLSLEFWVQHYQFTYRRFCVISHVVYTMDMASHGAMRGTISAEPSYCPEQVGDQLPSPVLLTFLFNGLLSILALLLLCYPIVEKCHAAILARRRRRRHNTMSLQDMCPPTDDDADDDGRDGDSQDTNLFRSTLSSAAGASDGRAVRAHISQLNSKWWWFAFVTDVLNMCTAFISVRQRLNYDMMLANDYLRFFVGLACMFSWWRLLPFVQLLGTRYGVLVTSLRDSTPYLLKFTAGVLPVYMGFAFFGVAVFGSKTRKFRNTGMSAQSLWAIINGDMLEDSFTDLSYFDQWVGQIYLYTYLILFLLIVSKMALAITEYFYFVNVPAAEVLEYHVEIEKKQQHTSEDGDDDEDEDDDTEHKDKKNTEGLVSILQASSNVFNVHAFASGIRTQHSGFSDTFRQMVRQHLPDDAAASALIPSTHTSHRLCLGKCALCACSKVYNESSAKLLDKLHTIVERSHNDIICT